MQLLRSARFIRLQTSELAIIGSIVVLGIVDWLGLLTPIRSSGEKLFIPFVASIQEKIRTLQEPIHIFTTRGVTVSQYQLLQRRYADALARIAELEGVEAENAVLREASSFVVSNQAKRRITVPIITADGTFIGAGSEDGIVIGSLVTARGALVGIVSETSQYQSRVVPLQKLPSDRPLVAKTATGVVGLLHGSGKKLLLSELSRDTVVETGTRVVTAGQDGIPEGIVVGVVRSIEGSFSAPTITAVIDQPSSIYETAVVEVW